MPSHRSRVRFLCLAATIALGGCATQEFISTAVRPGKYKLHTCSQLDEQGHDLLKRERELQALMQKAAQGPGGEFAIALAYQNEYNLTQGDLRELENAAAERKCQLKYRTASERAVR